MGAGGGSGSARSWELPLLGPGAEYGMRTHGGASHLRLARL